MFLIDSLLINGVRFVLDKVAVAVDQEVNDPTRVREELLAAQMAFELGEIDEEEFAARERDLLARLREFQERQQQGALTSEDLASGDLTVQFGDEDER